jgi:hypothetical protein
MKTKIRKKKIERFLKLFDKAVKAATEIPDYEFAIRVTARTSDLIKDERDAMIDEVTNIFRKYGW